MKDANSAAIFLSTKNQIRVRIIRRIKKNIKKENETTLPPYKERESVGVFSIQSFSVLFKRERVKR